MDRGAIGSGCIHRILCGWRKYRSYTGWRVHPSDIMPGKEGDRLLPQSFDPSTQRHGFPNYTASLAILAFDKKAPIWYLGGLDAACRSATAVKELNLDPLEL